MIIYPYINKFKKNGIEVIKYKNIIFKNIIGSGASGSVYKCIINGQLYCAKKFISDDYNTIDDMIDLLSFEINISNIVKNLNTCSTLKGISYNQINKKLNIYIIYLYDNDSINLENFINNKWIKRNHKYIYDFETDLKLQLIKQLIQSVKSLHENNIVHCDI